MNNNTLYIANRKRILERFIQLIIFMTIVITIYNFLRYSLNSNYKLSYSSIIGYLIVIIWITVTEVSIRKLEFNNEQKELMIIKKSLFGKEKNHIVPYSKLEYDVKTLNNFWGFLLGKKRLSLLNNGIELAKIKSNEEFDEKEIEKIIKSLIEVKNI